MHANGLAATGRYDKDLVEPAREVGEVPIDLDLDVKHVRVAERCLATTVGAARFEILGVHNPERHQSRLGYLTRLILDPIGPGNRESGVASTDRDHHLAFVIDADVSVAIRAVGLSHVVERQSTAGC